MLIIYGFLTCCCIICLFYLKLGNEKNRTAMVRQFLPHRIFQVMKKLYSSKEAGEKCIEFFEKKVKLCLLILCIGCMTAFFYELSELTTQELKENGLIERNTYGEGDKQIWLSAATEDAQWQEKIKLQVGEREYTEDEINELAKQAENDLVREILGDNASLDYVTQNLKLAASLEGYPFQIRWKSDMPLLLSKGGKLDTERLKEQKDAEKGVLVTLSAELIYRDFSRVTEFGVRVYPKEETFAVRFLDALYAAISAENEKTQTEEYQRLPQQIEGKQIIFREIHRQKGIYFPILGLAAGIAVYIRKDQELLAQEKERNKEMLKDYPRIVNKYALYYSAGMSSMKIWQKLCTDYQKERLRTNKKHYVYEEMLSAYESMQDGMGEMTAYENFALRCGLPRYRLFVSLIEQSLQKGKENMCILLEKEVQDAFADRKNRAKMLGEEAGTKLLLPMFLMLFAVLFIIIVPACFSFRM